MPTGFDAPTAPPDFGDTPFSASEHLASGHRADYRRYEKALQLLIAGCGHFYPNALCWISIISKKGVVFPAPVAAFVCGARLRQ